MQISTDSSIHEDVLARAISAAAARRRLAIHAIAFVIANAVNAAVDAADGGHWRVHWTLLGWGIGLACHAALVLGRPSLFRGWERRQLARMLERLADEPIDPPPTNEPPSP